MMLCHICAAILPLVLDNHRHYRARARNAPRRAAPYEQHTYYYKNKVIIIAIIALLIRFFSRKTYNILINYLY